MKGTGFKMCVRTFLIVASQGMQPKIFGSILEIELMFPLTDELCAPGSNLKLSTYAKRGEHFSAATASIKWAVHVHHTWSRVKNKG